MATLRKYGLTFSDWIELFNLQNGCCPICERPMENPCVDHYHVKNWRYMKPERRKLYVRGLTCNYCNRRMLARGMSLQRARNITSYLERFENRLQEQK